MNDIHFYKTIDPFGCFSNFSAHPVFVEEQSWRTSEHYFQAQKFVNAEIRHLIRMAETPMRAAQLGRSRDFPLRADWDEIKDDVMRSVVR
ncbi:MAG: NADAR family protein [Hyphomonas sp.]